MAVDSFTPPLKALDPAIVDSTPPLKSLDTKEVKSSIPPPTPQPAQRKVPDMGPYTSVPINAWYYNETGELPSSPHKYCPNKEVSKLHLEKLGVLTWTCIETEDHEKNDFLNYIIKQRGYNHNEVITVTPELLPDFEGNTRKFFLEHLHDHEEIRFIFAGVGYEDVRDFDGRWIRIEIKKGDLIVLPPGMYHRFTLDSNQYLKALLLYQEAASRIQFDQNATTDLMEVRLDYVNRSWRRLCMSLAQ